MGRFGNTVLAALLACSLVPASAGAAFADDATDAANGAGWAYELGTSVEHEAVAYVVDSGVRGFSLGRSPLDNAENLMDVTAGAAAEALGDGEDAASDDGAAEAVALARARVATNGAEAEAGRLVLVRDESKTTEQLIAELEADPRVVFAEPNAVVRTDDAEEPENLAADALADATAALLSGEGDGDSDGNGDGADGNGDGTSGNGGADGNDGVTPGGDGGDTPSDMTFGADKDEPASNLDTFAWGFRNDGRMSGTEAGAVDMGYSAWATEAVAPEEVIIAVIDSGVDASNPDLAPVMWDEGLKTPGLATTDKEDKYGFAAAADAEANLTSTTGITSYHGTHVAGTVGAAWNGKGISGLASNARIMAVRHDDTLAGMLQCFDYVNRACDAGVDVRVANNSWGFGQGMWRSVDLAVTEIGRQGVVSVFASGNSAFDNDAAASTATTLADNPYAIVVNALDPTGALSSFSQYGETTTDVMAPGSGILSTWATGKANAEGVTAGPNYLGEEDEDAVLYESFDAESHAADGIDENAQGTYFSFGTSTASVTDAGKRFHGDNSLAVTCSAGGRSGVTFEADLSNIAEKPRYVSIRYTGVGQSGSGAGLLAQVNLFVKTTDSEDGYPLTPKSGFGIGGDSWGGFYAELPENTDWKNFKLAAVCGVSEFDMTGGVRTIGDLQAGTVYVDSIGLGSDLVPYGYQQGTSMASPAVAGAATVLAGKGLANVAGDGADAEAKSAEKLAALVKGAAVYVERYEGLCSTSGYATVDDAVNLGPAITAVRDKETAVEIEGYFMPEDATTVELGDTEAEVEACADLGDDKARLTVRKPEGFAGGQTIVRVEASGKVASHRADLGARANVAYYDQTNLPVPSELATWGAWQLVGFNGNIYCLPRTTNLNVEVQPCTYMLRYRSDAQTWERVPLPTDLAEEAGLDGGIIDVSGATLDGALVLQLSDSSGSTVFVRYTADGTWEDTGCTFLFKNGAPAFATLASDGGSVCLFGGYGVVDPDTGKTGDSTAVYRVNFNEKQLEECGTLSVGRVRPQVSYGNGSFVVSGGMSTSYQSGGVLGAELVTPQSGGVDSDTGEEISAGWLAGMPVDTTELVDETGQLAWASGALADGFALVGPESKNGAADTYTLAGDGSDALTAYDKRASWQKLLAPAATAYRGQLYVLAGAQNEPYQVFSATAVETAEQPGDYVAPDPEPEPDPGPTPTPDVEQTNADALDKASHTLARTGDPLFDAVPILAGAGVLAFVGVVVAAVCRRRAGRR